MRSSSFAGMLTRPQSARPRPRPEHPRPRPSLPLQKISSKSVHKFASNPTDRQTNKQTDKQTDKQTAPKT